MRSPGIRQREILNMVKKISSYNYSVHHGNLLHIYKHKIHQQLHIFHHSHMDCHDMAVELDLLKIYLKSWFLYDGFAIPSSAWSLILECIFSLICESQLLITDPMFLFAG